MTIGAIIWGTVAIGGMLTCSPPHGPPTSSPESSTPDGPPASSPNGSSATTAPAPAPARVGVAMLAVSMSAIILDGHRNNALLVGIVGALVSAAAKGVWAIGMHTIRIRLDPKYEAYLRTLQQQTGTEQALALGERDRLITHDKTVRLKLALEGRHGGTETSVDQETDRPQSTPVQAAEQDVDQIHTAPEPIPVQAAARAADRMVQPEDQVAQLLKRLRLGEHITKSQAADILGVPESTAYRRLNAAKDQLRQYN
jgi:hypothetical protein